MAQRPPVKIGVLISGSGTNLQAIIDETERGTLSVDIRVVISNRAAAHGLERARKHGIAAVAIDHRGFSSREDFDRALLKELTEREVELVVCAGFMRLLSRVMLQAFPNRIMNIHPALLPSFPGIHGQGDAVQYGVRIAGCTVFFVNEGVDVGPIIIQAAVPVMPDDDQERLAERILQQEHRIYPEAIRLYQEGRLTVVGRTVVIQDFALSAPGTCLVNPRAR
jgi:phosphoribosylglycinamide formyltransferase-1